jgi:aldose 1-epimerase
MEFMIENDLLRVTVTQWGAQIKSVLRKSDGVEHIWNGNPEVWKYHTPVMFPYCGKVKDGRIEIRGRFVENAPAHGVVRTLTHELVSQTADSLTLAVSSSEETLSIFPYHFRFLTTFRLEGECLHYTLTVENTDNEDFPFGIGYHPGFAIPFDDQHSALDYELRFSDMESPICMETPTGLLNGRYYVLGNNMQSIPVTDKMFDAGSHCMVNLTSKTLGIYEKDSGRAVVCEISGHPYCLIWSQPGMPQFVCIEPWHSLPSTEEGSYAWEDKAAAAVVQPGRSWSTTMKIAFVR